MHENIDVDDRSVQIARSIVSRGVLKNGVRQWQGEGFVCEEDSAGTVDSVHVRFRSTSTNRNDRCGENWSNWMSSSNFREEKHCGLPAKWWLDSDIPRKFIDPGISRPLEENVFLVSFANRSEEEQLIKLINRM